MKTVGQDSLHTSRELDVHGTTYSYFSIPAAAAALGVDLSRLPKTLKVLLENVLRFENGGSYTVADARAIAGWLDAARSSQEVPFKPARILMQDFTGVPAVVDLAAMRDGVRALGGRPSQVNPLVPVDLVIDHSVMVDVSATADALARNVDIEFHRNGERYAFLRWGQTAFDDFRVVPPGTGICHQVNLEYLAQAVWTATLGGKTYAYPDTLYGTDSHTTMVNGMGVLGWGGRRHRGGGGDARPADRHADPRRDRLPPDRAAAGGGDRDRPGADGDADAAQEERGRQVRRVLRPRPGRHVAGGSRHHRQHGTGIRRHLRLLPGRSGDARLPASDRARRGADRAGRGVLQGTGAVARRRGARSGVHRHAGAGYGRGAALAGRAEAAAGPGAAARRRRRVQDRADQEPRRAGQRHRNPGQGRGP